MKRSSPFWLALAAMTVFGFSAACGEDTENSSKRPPQKSQGQPITEDPEDEEEPEPITYVLFLSEARAATAASVKEWARKGLAGAHGDTSEVKVAGSGNAYQIQCGTVRMKLEFAKGPWLDNHADLVRTTRDKRLREMLRRVNGHVICEIDDTFDEDDDARTAAVASMLHCLSGVVQTDTLAVYENDTGDFNYINDEVVAALAGEEPLEAFMIEVMPPVLMVDGDSTEMKAAVAEARRRWPEFSKAFREYSLERSPFIVKARFTEGKETEYMWVEVTSIAGGSIFGVLKNHPVALKELACDDEVRLDITRVADWSYPDDEGGQVGGFTIDLVRSPKTPATPTDHPGAKSAGDK